MRIGELGARVGVTTRTLRHYESLGLIRAERDSNGYRTYDESDVRAVREIRSLVDLGFTLAETQPFVDCLRAGHESAGICADSIAVYRRKLQEVDVYLDTMQQVRHELQAQLDDALRDRVDDALRDGVDDALRDRAVAEPLCELSAHQLDPSR
ncbi:MerR family transcriptional regulator [Luteipulveratus mongoliensis]|uniref:MerR family transcriptional regulator n=1 Tax=Luteipulveratus mongoliensis TaxID=571913 RepID=UPI0009F817F3|nr:MerR family transcriptional regulator [Luteipulveratus mongoliensis]